jgi:hypothetical protein
LIIPVVQAVSFQEAVVTEFDQHHYENNGYNVISMFYAYRHENNILLNYSRPHHYTDQEIKCCQVSTLCFLGAVCIAVCH